MSRLHLGLRLELLQASLCADAPRQVRAMYRRHVPAEQRRARPSDLVRRRSLLADMEDR